MPPDTAAILARNLQCLSRRSPGLARRVATAAPNPSLSFREAGDGTLVPVVHVHDGDLPLHSLVDPRREAERLMQSVGDSGYLVCFGLGGGFSAAAFLRRQSATSLLIVEKDAATLRSLLQSLPLSALLSDHRVSVTDGVDQIRTIIRSTYLPAIAGDLRSLPLRPWCRAEQRFFDAAAEELRSAAEEARSDYAVQARFGKRWFANIILNLPAAQSALPPRIRGQLAHVAAAGPSLEGQLPLLCHRADGSILFATDTALPALIQSGNRPEVIVSLDCQVYSYHHFLGGIPPQALVLFDLASPPFVVRRAGASAGFFMSAHPLSRFLGRTWRRFPAADTTGGNVTHAAVSLARTLGIAQVQVHGADFGYPRAKPYARGTYLYDYYSERQLRSAPLETSLTALAYGTPGSVSERTEEGIRYTTPALRDYKARMDELMRTTPDSPAPQPFEGSPARCSWRELLGGYADAVRSLTQPSAPLGAWFSGMEAGERELWMTLLPTAAEVLRETGKAVRREHSLEQARLWALDRVDRMVASGPQGL